MLLVEDGFLPATYFRELKSKIFSPEFKWTYSDSVAYTSEEDPEYYFLNRVFSDGTATQDFELVRPCLYFFEDKFNFKITALYSISVNMFTHRNKRVEHDFHVDMNQKHYVGLLYLNDCNGETLFEDGTSILPKENRTILFDGSMRHRSTLQTDVKRRVAINFNFDGIFVN